MNFYLLATQTSLGWSTNTPLNLLNSIQVKFSKKCLEKVWSTVKGATLCTSKNVQKIGRSVKPLDKNSLGIKWTMPDSNSIYSSQIFLKSYLFQNSKQSAKGYERIIREILRRSGYFSCFLCYNFIWQCKKLRPT